MRLRVERPPERAHRQEVLDCEGANALANGVRLKYSAGIEKHPARRMPHHTGPLFRTSGGDMLGSTQRLSFSFPIQDIGIPAGDAVSDAAAAVDIDACGHAASVSPPTAQLAAPMADVAMQRLYAHAAQPALYKDLWGAIAEYLPGADLHNLRAIHSAMPHWLDKRMTSFKVSADEAPQMLAAIANASHLKHIKSLGIFLCNGENFPGVIAGLGALRLENIDLTIMRHSCQGAPLTAVGLALLRDIRPASLDIWDFDRGTFSAQDIHVLGGLDYPIALRAHQYHHGFEHEADLHALAAIVRLSRLDIACDVFSDDVAQAFRAHPGLREVCLRPTDVSNFTVAISNKAIAALAGNTTLRKLHIGETFVRPGGDGIAALAANRTLVDVCVGSLYRPVAATDVMTLSTNTTLKDLQLGASGGWGHLTRMATLERLTVRAAFFSLEDARAFGQHARLQTLRFDPAPQFAAGAFASIARCNVMHLIAGPVALSAQDILALLDNPALRSLDLVLTSPFEDTVRQVIALASHPTLNTLSISQQPSQGETREGGAGGASGASRAFVYAGTNAQCYQMTEVDRMTMFTAWGPNRPTSALTVNF